jgi:hypothetical protein
MSQFDPNDDAAFVQAALGELPEVELSAGLQRRVAQIPILQARGPAAIPGFFRSARWLTALSLACAGLGVVAGLWTGQGLNTSGTATAVSQTTESPASAGYADTDAASLDALLVLAWGEDAELWNEGAASDDAWSE